MPPEKGVKWTLWWGELDYWRLQVRSSMFEVVQRRAGWEVENKFDEHKVLLPGSVSTKHNFKHRTSNLEPCLLILKSGGDNLLGRDDNLNEATTALPRNC